uniref:Uncharacterized protein n=1 Tax=Anguilla anguilla TaxID=7936 RepID=A0A0E9XY04_ANGAN
MSGSLLHRFVYHSKHPCTELLLCLCFFCCYHIYSINISRPFNIKLHTPCTPRPMGS